MQRRSSVRLVTPTFWQDGKSRVEKCMTDFLDTPKLASIKQTPRRRNRLLGDLPTRATKLERMFAP
jgi:hypothetical protein